MAREVEHIGCYAVCTGLGLSDTALSSNGHVISSTLKMPTPPQARAAITPKNMDAVSVISQHS